MQLSYQAIELSNYQSRKSLSEQEIESALILRTHNN